MTELDLDAVEARATEATPGPWHVHDANRLRGGVFAMLDGYEQQVAAADGRAAQFDMRGETADIMAANAEFIARARADVPALVAEVRRLRETGAAVRELVRHAFEQWESEADSGDAGRDAALAIYEAWVRALKGQP